MGELGGVEPGSGRLVPELAAGLEPKLQDALDHPIRREILRRLGDGRALRELARQLAPVGIGQVNYHLVVLRQSEVVVPAGEGSLVDGRPRYESTLVDDAKVERVLSATEEWDREQREKAGRHVAPLRRGLGGE